MPGAQDLLGGYAVNTKNRVELARGVARFFIRTSRVGEIWDMVASFRRPRPWLVPALVDLCGCRPVRTGLSDWFHPCAAQPKASWNRFFGAPAYCRFLPGIS